LSDATGPGWRLNFESVRTATPSEFARLLFAPMSPNQTWWARNAESKPLVRQGGGNDHGRAAAQLYDSEIA